MSTIVRHFFEIIKDNTKKQITQLHQSLRDEVLVVKICGGNNQIF